MWTDLPTAALLGGFLLAAVVIFFSGRRMTGVADRLADRTGLGEAIVGGVLLGAATSLSGIIVSITAALDGRASLAFSNAVGGIAAQTCSWPWRTCSTAGSTSSMPQPTSRRSSKGWC